MIYFCQIWTFISLNRYTGIINMTVFNLTLEMKIHSMLLEVVTNHGNLKRANFLKVPKVVMFKVRNDLKASNRDMSSVAKRKKYCIESNIIRMVKFVQQINESHCQVPDMFVKPWIKSLTQKRQYIFQQDLTFFDILPYMYWFETFGLMRLYKGQLWGWEPFCLIIMKPLHQSLQNF